MKPNNSYIFSIALSLLFSLAISCTKDTPNSNQVLTVCDNCRQDTPPTITVQFKDSSWTGHEGGQYISHLNDLIRSKVDTIKHIYNVSIHSENGSMQVPLNFPTNCYDGTIFLTNSQGENNLIYNSKKIAYYGQTVYAPLPFSSLDVTIEMEK